MDRGQFATLKCKRYCRERKYGTKAFETYPSQQTNFNKAKKPRRQKTAPRIEASNWQKHKHHADFQLASTKDCINYDELGTNDLKYDYLIQAEYASCLIYPVNLTMENGHWCSWKRELESVSPNCDLNLHSLLGEALRKHSEQVRRNLERNGWNVIENNCDSMDMERDDSDGFVMV
jgi:hypothetical protein